MCSNRDSKIHTIVAKTQGIGTEDAKVIGNALRTSVCSSLTSLDVRFNDMNVSGQEAIMEAVRGKEGFTLKI